MGKGGKTGSATSQVWAPRGQHLAYWRPGKELPRKSRALSVKKKVAEGIKNGGERNRVKS